MQHGAAVHGLLLRLQRVSSVQRGSNEEPEVLPRLRLDRVPDEAVGWMGGIVGGSVTDDLLDDLRGREASAGTIGDTEGDRAGDVRIREAGSRAELITRQATWTRRVQVRREDAHAGGGNRVRLVGGQRREVRE